MKNFLILFILLFTIPGFCQAQTKVNIDSIKGTKLLPSISKYKVIIEYLGKSSSEEMGLYKDEVSGKWFFIDETGCKHYQNDNSESLLSTDYWGLEGNTGTDSTINFLGTTDSTNLILRTNNISRLNILADGSIKMLSYKNNNITDSVLTTDANGKLILTGTAVGSILVADSISDLNDYTGNKDLIFIKDSLRGGFFYKYIGLVEVDSGMVFNDAVNRKWMRYVEGNKINIQWYGAIANGAPDLSDNTNYNAITKAIQFATNSSDHKTIFIPGNKSNYYYISNTITIQDEVNIEGEGNSDVAGAGIFTKLVFPVNTKCFLLDMKSTGGGNVIEMKKLSVSQLYDPPFNNTAHIFDIRCVVRMQDIFIPFAAGNGINIQSCAIPTDPYYGNADKSKFENINVNYCYNGFYMEGCDANAMTFNDISAVNCTRWGIWDNSFLGNTFNTPHLAYNGRSTVVLYGGKCYICIADSGSTGDQPDISPDWKEVPGLANSGAWDAGKTYYSGGCYYVSNFNAFTTFNSPYTEEGQPSARLNGRSISLNGDQGSGVSGGGYLHEINGQLWLHNGDFIMPSGIGKIGLGVEPLALFHIKSQDSTLPTAIIESIGQTSGVTFRNNNGGGTFNFIDNDLYTYNSTETLTRLNSNYLSPVANNKLDLGTSDFPWKNVYAYNYNFGNWKGNVISPAYGGTGLSSYTPYSLLAGGITSTGTLQQISGTGSSGQALISNGTGALPTWQNIPNNNWGLAGNAGTDTTYNFLGTTDNQGLIFKTNAITRLTISAAGNLGIGTSTPSAKLEINGNIKIIDGTEGLGKVLTSDASGGASWQSPGSGAASWALLGNAGTTAGTNFIGTTDAQNLIFKTNNIFSGQIDITNNNTSFGQNAYNETSTGQYNTAIGKNSLKNNTTGNYNTSIGYGSLASNTTGYFNTASGHGSLTTNTTGYGNTAIGVNSLVYNTSGTYNTGIGLSALQSNTTGYSNTANGYSTLFYNTTGYNNTATGLYSLYANTTGYSNTANGYSALGANTTGYNNVAIGMFGATDITTGAQNTIIGNNTGRGITTGNHNTIIGANVTGLTSGLSNNIILADGQGVQRLNINDIGNVGIGITTPHASAQLEVSSTTKGFLPPRVTTTERNNINSPAEGLIIYNTSTHKLNVFTGSIWEEITSN